MIGEERLEGVGRSEREEKCGEKVGKKKTRRRDVSASGGEEEEMRKSKARGSRKGGEAEEEEGRRIKRRGGGGEKSRGRCKSKAVAKTASISPNSVCKIDSTEGYCCCMGTYCIW